MVGVILNGDLYRATLGTLLPPLIAGSLLSPLQIPCPFLPSLRCSPVYNDYVKLILHSEGMTHSPEFDLVIAGFCPSAV